MDQTEKKRSVSKKTVVIASILTILIGAPIAIFLINRNATSPQATWYDSNWNYKRSVEVANTTGFTITNADVLISYDTGSLVTASKLQADCDDLRFVDSDDSTVLTYWIEGGCNTSTTQIWIRIPSLPSGGKTIYMYYGNTGIGAGEQSWSGNFVSLSDQSTCASGWSRVSAYDSSFPKGSTSYGTTGGASTHSHTASASSVGSQSATTTVQGGASWGSRASTAHGHSTPSVSLTTDVSHLPPYVNMLFCGKSKLDIGTNHITLFDVGSFTGWTRYTALDDRFPIGASSSIGTTGGAITHTHTASFGSLSASSSSQYIGTTCVSNCHTPADSGHTHSVSTASTSETSNNIPAYLNMVFMKKDSAGTLSTEQPIYMVNTATMPLGWTRFSDLDSKSPRGQSTYGGTGGVDSHSHSGSKTSQSASASLSALWYESGNFTAASGTHNHSISWSSNTVNNIPPYVETVFAKRKSSQTTNVGTEQIENTAPTAPTSLLTEGATNPTNITDTTPEFSAICNDPDDDNCVYYEIEVNTNSAFTGTVMWDTNKTSMTSTANGARSPDFSYAGSTLTAGVTYYWRIRFWDTYDAVSPWASYATFKINQDPTKPTALLTEGATNPTNITDTTPEFSAVCNDPDSDNCVNYEIEVNTNSAFTGTVMWDTGKTSMTSTANGVRSPDFSYAGTTLNAGVTYYWRIRFWDTYDSVSPWADYATFKINQDPTAPTSLLTEGDTNPTNVLDTTPEFSAVCNDLDGDNCVYYEIEVNTNSAFTGTVMWDSNKTAMTSTANGARSPDFSYAGSTLTAGVTYYWRIRFWDTYDGISPWASYGTFILAIEPNAPSSLTTDGKTNPSLINSLTPKFSAVHTDINGNAAVYYEIEVNTNSSFNGTVMWDTGKTAMTSTANNTRSPELTYAGTSLSNNGVTYYWRIRFWDTNDLLSTWSSTANFASNLSGFFMNGLKLEDIRIN